MPYTRVSVGMRYGRLTVVEFARLSSANKKVWKCACECGGVAYPTSQALNSGHTQSCGCLMIETARICRVSEATHGATIGGKPSKTYQAWVGMRRRCLSKDDRDYPTWGGRGITIDDRWDDFSAFLEDMGEKPEGMSLDRINNDGPYCKDNCRWASGKTQGRNRRTTRLNPEAVKEILSDPRPQAVIADTFGVSQTTIHHIKTGKHWS